MLFPQPPLPHTVIFIKSALSLLCEAVQRIQLGLDRNNFRYQLGAVIKGGYIAAVCVHHILVEMDDPQQLTFRDLGADPVILPWIDAILLRRNDRIVTQFLAAARILSPSYARSMRSDCPIRQAGVKNSSFIPSGESCFAPPESEKLTADRSDAVTI